MELFRDEEETGETEREETGINIIPARRPAGAFGFNTSYLRGEGYGTINPMGNNPEQPINYPQIFAIVERDSRLPATAYTGGFRPFGNLPILPPIPPAIRDSDTGATII